MENNIEQSTETTVVNETNEAVIENSNVESKVIETKKEDNFIPRSRFNEIINQKNELKQKLEEMESLINNLNNEKAEVENTYKQQIDEVKNNLSNEMSNIKNKYEESLYKNSGAEDIEYLKFLVKSKVDNGIDLELAINEIKNEKPNLFIENRKSIGSKPSSNNNGKYTKESFAQITDRNERMRILREGLLLKD